MTQGPHPMTTPPAGLSPENAALIGRLKGARPGSGSWTNTLSAIIDATRAEERARTGEGWKPIDENTPRCVDSGPRDNGMRPVIVTRASNSPIPPMAFARLTSRGWVSGKANSKLWFEPTHWRPFPAAAKAAPEGRDTFQARVQPWMMACFGAEIAADRLERNDRFIEEALELVQASGYPRERALELVDYVYGRPQGEINQEVGGVMITLAAHCLAFGLDMHEAGETELARIWTKVEQIREKQKAKPKGSALPIAAAPHLDREG